MTAPTVVARWSTWAPQLRSLLRIMAAFTFMQFGTAKLFAFPGAIMPGGGHRARRVAARRSRHPGGVRRPVPARRAVHPSGRLSAGRRDGGRLFSRPRVARLLDGPQSGHARRDLLLRVAVPLGRRRRAVEPRRADRPLEDYLALAGRAPADHNWWRFCRGDL